MKILLIAYDYPPTRSPRALRWRYLSRELALLGHEVHVLIPDLGEPDVELPQSPGVVAVHRTFPGPFGRLVRAANRHRANQGNDRSQPTEPSGATRLNWRGRLVDLAKRLSGWLLFPDVRAEWTPWARRALRRILVDVEPDVVITSHEPASTLPLGIHARRRGFAWVADLGDPVCAAYTPRRWRTRALALEARVSALADHVLVTTDATRRLLVQRHGQDPGRCAVLPNGYDDRRRSSGEGEGEGGFVSFDEERLELIFAGRLYGYRDPAPLLHAVSQIPGVRLTLVVPDPPPVDGAAAISAASGERVRAFGPLPHAQVQRMLERADVLVNFGDRGQPVRIPAKLYEYLGIDRPILHVQGNDEDAGANLLRGLHRGWLCADDPDALAALLQELLERKRQGRLHDGLVLSPLSDYAHSTLGRRLEALLEETVKVRHHAGSGPAEPPRRGIG